MKEIIQSDCENIIHQVDLRPLRGKRVLVAGATGLLGQYIVRVIALGNKKQNLKCSIDGVSLHGPSRILGLLKGDRRIRFLKRDLARPFKLPRKYDYIFHAAGYGQPARFMRNPLSVVAINVDATEAFLKDFLLPLGTMIFFSSGDIYGDVPKSIKKIPESFGGIVSPVGPRSVYAESKRLGEALVADFVRAKGLRGRIARISHVYGPGVQYDDARVMSDFIRKGLEKKEIQLLDDGSATKTYGYVADVTTMILYVGLHGKELVYNIGGARTMSIKELAQRVARQCGAKVTIPKAGLRPLHIGADPRFMRLDLSKIRHEMKKFYSTPFATGLSRTIDWFRYLRGED